MTHSSSNEHVNRDDDRRPCILVPTDFSSSSRVALEAAALLARGSCRRLLIVHVKEPQSLTEGFEDLFPSAEASDDERFRHLKQFAPDDSRVPCEHRLLIGATSAAILDVAEAEPVELIVLGSHGRRGVNRLLMGSVAEGVMLRAKCPVLMVRLARSDEAAAAKRDTAASTLGAETPLEVDDA